MFTKTFIQSLPSGKDISNCPHCGKIWDNTNNRVLIANPSVYDLKQLPPSAYTKDGDFEWNYYVCVCKECNKSVLQIITEEI